MKSKKPLARRLAAWMLCIAMVLTMLPLSALAVTTAPVAIGEDGEAVITPQPDETDPTGETEETEAPENPAPPQEPGEAEDTEEQTGEPEAAAPTRRSAARGANTDYVKIKLNGTELQLNSGEGIANNNATQKTTTQNNSNVAWYSNGTLTLNGLQADYIECYRALTIQVNSNSKLNGWVEAGSNNSHRGIYASNNLTITGSGTLSVSTASYSGDRSPYGIYCDSSLTLNGANVTVSGANGSYGIYARNGITVNGGTLGITAKDTGMYCYAGSISIKGGATVNINGTPTNGIYIHNSGKDKLLTISEPHTEVNIHAVTGYAVGNRSTVTTGAATATANIIVEKGAKLTIGSCQHGLYSECSGVRITNSAVTVTSATDYGIWLQRGAGILEITGSSVVNLTGGSSAVTASREGVSNINLTSSGGSVTMKKTDIGSSNYAMDGWVELGNNTVVSGGTTYGERLTANQNARKIEGTELTFFFSTAQLKITGWDNSTNSEIDPGWLSFETGKAVNLQLSINKAAFSGSSDVRWIITGLPAGLTKSETNGSVKITGTPTGTNETYNVSITAEAYGKTATVTRSGTVQAATLTGTLTIGSTSYDINSNNRNIDRSGNGWSWDRTTQVLTLKKYYADFGGNYIYMVNAMNGSNQLPLHIHLEGSNRIYLDKDLNTAAAIKSNYGVKITGEPGSTLEIVMDNSKAEYGILCDNSELFANDIAISEDVTVEFSIKNTSSPVTAIYTNNGDVTLLGSVTVTQWSSLGVVGNKAVTGIEVDKTHRVWIGDGPSSRASLTVEYLFAEETTAIKAGGVLVNTASNHTAITTNFDEGYSKEFKSIDLIPEGFPEGKTCGLYVISGKLDMRGVDSTVVSGRGPVFLSGSADVKITGYGKSNDGIYLTGEGSDVTIASGGKLNIESVSDGIRTDGKLQVNDDKDCPYLATLKVDDARGIAVAAKKGIEIYGNSQVDLTTSNATVVYTINNNGDNGNSTVDLSTGGHVKLTSKASPAATQVWAGPIKLGSHTTCTGTKNQMDAPEGYHQYNCTDGRMEFTFSAGGGTTDPAPEPTGVTVSGTVTSYGDAAEKVTVTLLQGETTVGTWSGITGPYIISNVAPGTYTLRVEKKGHATFTKEITVTDSNVTENVTIYLYGDINGDGMVKPNDKNILAKYLAKWPGYETLPVYDAVADLNNDNAIRPGDKNILAKHLAKWPGYETLPMA